MSKIQKALGKLRNSNDAALHPDKPGNSPVTSRRSSVAPQPEEKSPQGFRLRTRHLEEGGSLDENLPSFTINVVMESLHQQGLRPRESDLDAVADQFRRIKRPILNIAFGVGQPDSENANVIMVASALPKTGKSFCSFNLATSIAIERDVGAILVDADVLKPNISHAFGVVDRIGLIDYLLDPTVTVDDILVGTDLHDIIVIPSGQQHPEATELLASRRMQQLVETLSRRFKARAIIVDTPPLLVTNEAKVLAEHMGQIVLVIEAGVSPQDSVMQVLNSLNRAKPINAILNKARAISFGNYEGSGYGYQSVPRRGQQDAKDPQ